MTNESILYKVTGMDEELVSSHLMYGADALTAMNLARADEREGKWIKITGEDSLPKDNEALCLFVQWKDINTNLSRLSMFTHYTIVTPPNQ